jgi:hypothetical protein
MATTYSVRETLMAAVISALNGTGHPSNITAQRERTVQIDSTAIPGIIVKEEDEDVTRAPNAGGPIVKRSLTIKVEVRAAGVLPTGQGATYSPPAREADPLVTWCVKALVPARGVSGALGGLANDVQETGVSWSRDQADTPVVKVTLTFVIDYQTRRDDATLAS